MMKYSQLSKKCVFYLTLASLFSLLCLVGCGTKIDCGDNTQMLSPDRDVRAAWLQQCKEVNRRVKINGAVQSSVSD